MITKKAQTVLPNPKISIALLKLEEFNLLVSQSLKVFEVLHGELNDERLKPSNRSALYAAWLTFQMMKIF